ncbi:hypothetical protein ACFXPX_04525 [Kitasatospora sp. NPDC059146]|uniref:hypothetical protein n=1 Tax=unclassified Kitasatospora TaxID=2633591 RepID=UPI0036B2A1FC
MATRALTTAEASGLGFDTSDPAAGALRHIDIGTMANGYPSDLVVARVEGGWIWHFGEEAILCDSEAEADALFDRDLTQLVRDCADPFEKGGSDFLWDTADVLIATVGYEEYGDGAYCVSRIDGTVSWTTHTSREKAVEEALELAAGLLDEALPADPRAPLARYVVRARVYLALSSGDGLAGPDGFCEQFDAAEDDTWFPNDHQGVAMARVGTWWVVATNDSVNGDYLAFSLHEDEDEARTELTRGIGAYYKGAEDIAYDWTAFDGTAFVRAAPVAEQSHTYAVVAVLGDRESVLLTVDGRSEAATRAAETLAQYAARTPVPTEADDTQTAIQYQAMQRRVLQDTVAALADCEALLGDAIRRADLEGLYGRGRDLTWIQVAHRLGVVRDTVQEIRNGNAWKN